ncbi:hypothetical protein MMC30_002567 [Trapelia coarctata]|nr:hypothetical protein [Trapelia coarctata]
MDPLSLSASIAGLITLADVVVDRVYTYIKGVKNARKEIAALLAEVTGLFGILNSLRLVVARYEEPGVQFQSTMQINHVYACDNTLVKIKALIDKDDPSQAGSSFERMKRQLHWPLTGSETKELTAEVERHKSTLSLALNADGMNALLQALSRHGELQAGIDSVCDELQRRRELDSLASLTAERRKILDCLGTVDPKRNQSSAIKLRYPGTGMWFIEGDEFKSWRTIRNAKLWLYGIPGAGKTILTSSIIQDLQQSLTTDGDDALAYYYFDYTDAATQEPSSMLGSIVKQLVAQNTQCFEEVQQYYRVKGVSTEETDRVQFSISDYQEILRGIAKCFDNTMLVIDALDESDVRRDEVLDILSNIDDGHPDNNFKILLVSRDEYDIRERLSDYTPVPISARTSDIRLYVAAELEKRIRERKLRLRDRALKEHIMERLIERADGMFRWVVCQMDYLCSLNNDAARRRALNSLPPDLPSTYERILERVNSTGQENRIMVRRVLQWIIGAKEPLSITALAEAVSVDEGDDFRDADAIPDVNAILEICGSLVRRSSNQNHLELAHFTVKEFLFSIDPVRQSSVAAYRLDDNEIDIELAKVCLTYLCLADHDGSYCESSSVLETRHHEFPFLPYAVMNWDHHAVGHLEEPEICQLTQELFAPSKTDQFLAWSQAYTLLEDRNFRQLLAEHVSKDKSPQQTDIHLGENGSPLHFAAYLALPDLCQWLLKDGCDPNQSVAHFFSPLRCALEGQQLAVSTFGYSGASSTKFDKWRDPFRRQTVDILLKAGADGSLLLRAALGVDADGDGSFTKMLLQSGATCNRSCLEFINDLMNRKTAIPWLKDLFTAVQPVNLSEQGDRTRFLELQLLFESSSSQDAQHAANLSLVTEYDSVEKVNHLLWIAAKRGQRDVVRRIASHTRANIDAALEQGGTTALYQAAEFGHVDVAELLLQLGANINTSNSHGETVLHAAARAESRKCFSLFLAGGADPRARDKDGITPIHLAVKGTNVHLLELLLPIHNEGPSLMTRTVCQNRTPVLLAAASGQLPSLKFLLENFSGADIFDKDHDNISCLHLAAEGGTSEMVEFALQNGLSITDMSNDGKTILHYVVDSQIDMVAKLELILNDAAFPLVLSSSFTAVHHLCSRPVFNRSHYLFFTRLLSYIPVDRDMVNRKVAREGSEPYTALQLLCNVQGPNEHSIDIFGTICDRPDIDLDVLDSKGRTPLILAIQRLNKCQTRAGLSSIEILVDRGASVLVADQNGQTALHYICRDTPSEWTGPALDLLLSKGANSDAINNEGASAFSMIVNQWILKTPNPQKSELEKLLRLFIAKHPAPAMINALYKDDPLIGLALAFQRHDFVSFLLDYSVDVDRATVKGWTPLNHACLRGCSIVLLRRMLDRSLNMFRTTPDGWSLIHWATEGGHNEIILELLDRGFDLEARTNDSRTPLHIAIQLRRPSAVSLLLQRGANVEAKARSNLNAAHFGCRVDSKDILQILLKTKIDWEQEFMFNGGTRTTKGVTCLQFAAGEGKTNAIEFLLDNSLVKNINQLTGDSVHSALCLAAEGGHATAVALLISRGANIDQENAGGDTPLMGAAQRGHTAVVRTLIDSGCNIYKINSRGYTAERLAELHRRKATAQLIRACIEERGLDFLLHNCASFNADPPLTAASETEVSSPSPSIAQKDHEASAKATKALSGAIDNGNLDMCRRLIKAGATINQNIDGSEGCTVFLSALAQSHIAIASLLLDEGVDVKGQVCSKHPLRHYTAVHIAAKFGFDGILQRLLGLDPPQLGEFPVDPIHIAAAENRVTSLKLLLEHDPMFATTSNSRETNPDVAIQDSTASMGLIVSRVEVRTGLQDMAEWSLGSYSSSIKTSGHATPLHIASQYGHTGIVRLLLGKGANVDARDDVLATPLQYATSAGQTTVLRILLDAGASLECRTSDGTSLVTGAAGWGRVDILEELRQRGADFEATDMVGGDAMMNALKFNHSSVVPTLMTSGYNFCRTTPMGFSALRIGLLARDPQIRNLVMAHAPPEVDQCHTLHGNLMVVLCAYPPPVPVLQWVMNRIPHELKAYHLNFKSVYHGTPLYAAAYSGYYRGISLLLRHGVIVDEEGGPLGTPLMAACAMGRADVVELLVQNGASLIILGEDGTHNSAWDHAKHYKDILKYLDSHAG